MSASLFPTCRFFHLPLSLAVALMLCFGCGQEGREKKQDDPGESIFQILSSVPVLEAEIITNYDSLAHNKEDEEYQPATFLFTDSTGQRITYDIKVSARGVTRKNYCEITPMRLKFPKSLRREEGLADFKKLKLVAPCKDSTRFVDLVLREYLCYRLYGLLTDQSFRVQLAKIRIRHSASGEDVLNSYAFFLENQHEMALRLDGVIMDESNQKLTSIDRESYNTLTVFQYMIGNTDWNLSIRHNIKLVNSSRSSSPVPVPYDFDFSGMVNAPYARPHPDIPIKDVRERLFQWRGKNAGSLQTSVQLFLDKKQEIYQTIETFELLPEASRADIRNYINAFYAIIESDQAVEALVADRGQSASK